ncbi:hypothetical protein E2C01_028957 [Portunus trituberculatus]|uniref:Uncharacterized protein n=1 Tax=Portunus trituberculatus TaxID=210409 RepID=A0A5B7EMX0_PORTR|nr:hypothetical protein [Portunus trituberculatus]
MQVTQTQDLSSTWLALRVSQPRLPRPARVPSAGGLVPAALTPLPSVPRHTTTFTCILKKSKAAAQSYVFPGVAVLQATPPHHTVSLTR